MSDTSYFRPYPKPVSKTQKKNSKIGIGKKTRSWIDARDYCKKQFEAWGITRCELQLEGCWHAQALSFAHIDKRKYLTPEELTKVVLACVPCHQRIEMMQRKDMRKILETIIENRIL